MVCRVNQMNTINMQQVKMMSKDIRNIAKDVIKNYPPKCFDDLSENLEEIYSKLLVNHGLTYKEFWHLAKSTWSRWEQREEFENMWRETQRR